MLTAVIVIAAVVAGVTGAWSPCGFSMVETLAPAGYAGRLRTTAVACVTFAAGALAGGVLTFGGLALLGSALGAGAPVVAAAIALAAAAGEARGARIVPQVRRQVPESWRRVLPVPLAAGLYGLLLGLGFTTFILSFAVWALAGISVVLGDPAIGLAIGLGFGAGRALPVIALAPSGGGGLHAAMAERPRILRSLRALDAAALAVCAAALFTTPAYAAVQTFAPGYSDPSADGATVALHRPGAAGGEVRGPAGVQTLPGNHPALGEGRTAWIETGNVVVAGVASIPASGADAVAVSSGWVAWRSGTSLVAASLDPASGFIPRVVVTGAVGRPALTGGLLVFDRAGPHRVGRPQRGHAHDPPPRGPRAAHRPVRAPGPAELRPGDLPPPAGADRTAQPAPHEQRRCAVRARAGRAPRRRPRARPLPRPRPHQPAAVGPRPRGRHVHADDHRARRGRRLRDAATSAQEPPGVHDRAAHRPLKIACRRPRG